MKRLALIWGAVVAFAAAGCGPLQPQAPLPEAKTLNDATSAISTACGEAYQLTAFPGAPRSLLETLEATASSSVKQLAGVYHRNPSWVYQGETIGQIVSDADGMLGSCGLTHAQSTLRRATR
jgi:hypothetical protein